MRTFAALLGGLLCSTVAATSYDNTDRASLPVCVVGAGAAGLTVAANLEKKGKKVVVFEQRATVGGKCQAVYEK